MSNYLYQQAGSPGPEHQRLRRELSTWAETRGYKRPYAKLTDEVIPDVVKGDEVNRFLFVGDAKDAANETSEKEDTVSRLEKYFREFAKLLGQNWKGGTLAVATNDKEAAVSWTRVLNDVAVAAGLSATGGARPNFTVYEYSSNTWIVWW